MICPITEIPIPCTYYFCILFATAYLLFKTFDFIVNVTIDKLLFSYTASLELEDVYWYLCIVSLLYNDV